MFSIQIKQHKLCSRNLNLSSTPNQTHLLHLTKPSLNFLPKSPSPFNLIVNDNNYTKSLNRVSLKASSSNTDVIPIDDDDFENPTQKLKVVVKSIARPRLVLKFLWMQKDIGIALDQTIPGHGTIPLSPYYFWPRKDAWEELKLLLESKTWIPPMQRVILLNQATDIINLWQESGGNIS
ncbi:hypothetical protein ACFE04_007781 [Oxalis oulophora]